MLITPHTKSYLACPCGKGEWELPDADKVWPVYQWYCDECGVKFNIQRMEEGTFSVTPSLERKRKILVTLESIGPVRVLVEGMVLSDKYGVFNPEDEDFEHERYFYEEHTCPTNWTPNIIQVIDPTDGDTDPHGLFELKKIEEWRELED